MCGYTVYMHIAPNGKKYVGITRRNVAQRWGKEGQGYKKCSYFWHAIEKYGWDNIAHQVISTGLTGEEAKQSEKELIRLHETRDHLHGYNLTDGGDGISGCKRSAETRARIGAAMLGNKCSLGKTRTIETRKKLSAALIGNKRTLGYRPTAETLEKMRAVQIGNKYNLGKKRSAEARANISAAQKGRVATEEAKKNMRDAQRCRSKGVECLTVDGEFIAGYISPVEAADKTGIDRSCIWSVCSGKRRTAGGFKWRYASTSTQKGVVSDG